jgi:hypothetical protein
MSGIAAKEIIGYRQAINYLNELVDAITPFTKKGVFERVRRMPCDHNKCDGMVRAGDRQFLKAFGRMQREFGTGTIRLRGDLMSSSVFAICEGQVWHRVAMHVLVCVSVGVTIAMCYRYHRTLCGWTRYTTCTVVSLTRRP